MKSVAISFFAGLGTYITFLFWWGIALVLIIFGIKTKRLWLRFMLLTVSLMVIWKPLWGIFPGYQLAKMECEQIGGFHGKENLPFVSDSVLLIDDWAKDRYYFELFQAGRLLLQNHVKRVEIKQKYDPAGNPFYGYQEKYLEDIHGQGDYFVFTVSNSGDPACRAFETKIRNSLDEYRRLGLAPGKCIAIHREKTSKARVVLRREGGVKHSWISYEFDRFTMVDSVDSKKKVENYRFAYYGLNPYYTKKFTVNCEGMNMGAPYYGDLLGKELFGEEHTKLISQYQSASSTFRDAVELAKHGQREERLAAADAFNAFVSSDFGALREYARASAYLVRWATAQNRSTPTDVLETLISDTAPDVSQAAVQTLEMVRSK